jgi:hypothetical protein
VVAVVAPISGRLADRIGTRWLASAGMALPCLGLVCLARLDERTGLWGAIWPQLIAALGQGLFQSPNNSAIMGAAPADRRGVAAGMLATGRTMGQAISVAIAGAVFGSPAERTPAAACSSARAIRRCRRRSSTAIAPRCWCARRSRRSGSSPRCCAAASTGAERSRRAGTAACRGSRKPTPRATTAIKGVRQYAA